MRVKRPDGRHSRSVATDSGPATPALLASSTGRLATPSGIAVVGTPPPSLTTSTGPNASPSAALPSAEVVAPTLLPLRGTALDIGAMVAPRPIGGLFAAMSGVVTGGALLAAFDAMGKLRPGWPILLPGWESCWLGSDLADDSLRALCEQGYPALARAFAFDALALVGIGTCLDWTLAADGTAFVIDTFHCQAELPWHAAISAFGLDGELPGWHLQAPTSIPIVGPNGRVYIAQGPTGQALSRIRVIERSGRPVTEWSVPPACARP